MEIRKVSLDKLIPWENNPRKMPKSELDKLEKSIKEFGYVEPIVWNEQTGKVVGGHQRLKVLQQLGEKEIEVVVVNLDGNKEKLLNLALNRIHGDWDEEKLTDIIREFEKKGIDISISGFDDEELIGILGGDIDIAEKDMDSFNLKNKCPKCGFEW